MISLRPDKPFKYSLKAHAYIPAGQRPHFLCKTLSAGQLMDYIDRLDTFDPTDRKKENEQMDGIIRELVTGLGNFGDMTLDAILNDKDNGISRRQKMQLIWGILNENEMSEDEIKNSVSPSPSGTAA